MSEIAPPGRRGRLRVGHLAALLAKLAVTGLCFWYLSRKVDGRDLVRAVATLDLRWAGLAVVVVMLQIPLVGLRWSRIVDALARDRERVLRRPMIAITAIANFFAQVMPNVAADTVRAWMLTHLGRSWRTALVSVMIDRAVGVGGLFAVGVVVLLLPSELVSLAGYRVAALEVFGTVLAVGILALLFARPLAPLLQRWRFTAWAGQLAGDAHQVLLGSPTGAGIGAMVLGVHLMSILSIWLLARAAGLSVSGLEAAVLFTVMIVVLLIPVSISGWGVRELAVTSLLGTHGVPLERALFFSVSFGLVLLVAALPGALVWAIYTPTRLRHLSAAEG